MVNDIKILSIFEDKLLVGEGELSNQLLIYNSEITRLTKIATNYHQPIIRLIDATWTPRGSILIVADNGLVVLTQAGKITSRTNTILSPNSVTVSSDGILYVSDFQTGVHKSSDEGVTWNLLFESRLCVDVVKVITNQSEDFWTRQQSGDSFIWYLFVYSFDKKNPNGNVTRRGIDIHQTIRYISFNWSDYKLATDGSSTIFLLDRLNKAVHIFSADGQYKRKLLISNQWKMQMGSIAVNIKRQVLYVGRNTGLLSVFKLI